MKNFKAYELGKKYYQEGKRIDQSPYLSSNKYLGHQGWFEKGFNDAKSSRMGCEPPGETKKVDIRDYIDAVEGRI